MKHQFEATMLTNPKFKNSAYVDIPFSVEEVFGTKGQVKVIAHFDGIPYRGSIANMGTGCHILIIRKDIRAKLNKKVGDTVLVELEKDTGPRVVEIPTVLQEKFAAFPEAKIFFDSLSYTHRKEYVRWITSAKREETRIRRLEKSIDLLLKGTKTPG
ncbi:MAG: YdeI/OmpD-associated family protein [Bacteroidota bacterium]